MMSPAPSPASPAIRVLFRVAAGSRVGFGHLVRCRSLARALGIAPRASVRGTAATRRAAIAMGWSLAATSGRQALAGERPDVLVVDDPSAPHAAVWVRAARRIGIPVATIHDLGLGRVASDLFIDGSVLEGRGRPAQNALVGPAHMILDPDILAIRQRHSRPRALHVLIALGGGSHVYQLAVRIARAIADRVPDVRIRAAAGFSAPRRQPVLPRGRWVTAPDGLARELAQATVAVVAGGVTLYEACALGVPAVALAVTAAQHRTVRGVAKFGAAVDAGRPPLAATTIARVADAAAALVRDARRRRQLSACGRRLVDGRGAFRVADRVRELAINGTQRPQSTLSKKTFAALADSAFPEESVARRRGAAAHAA
jgi:UDP-2,4-diacetamido-2,4,6-trideoxy-beta-L-altropyranose hydrolase